MSVYSFSETTKIHSNSANPNAPVRRDSFCPNNDSMGLFNFKRNVQRHCNNSIILFALQILIQIPHYPHHLFQLG